MEGEGTGSGGVTGRGLGASEEEGLQSTDFLLSLRDMQGIIKRNGLNWLFGVS